MGQFKRDCFALYARLVTSGEVRASQPFIAEPSSSGRASAAIPGYIFLVSMRLHAILRWVRGGLWVFVFGSNPSLGNVPGSNTTPCAVAPEIVFPLDGAPPSVASSTGSQLSPEAMAPSCLGWQIDPPLILASVWGRFQAAEGDEAVLSRLGAISHFRAIHYWSVTDRRVEELITQAFAVNTPTTQEARDDFTSSEIVQGRELFFVEQDNRLPNPVVYRLSVIERRRGHIVIALSNVSPVRRFLFTLFEPGDLRTAFFLDQVDGVSWTCYAVSGYRPRALASLLDNGKSQRNRLLALVGHVTGYPEIDLPWTK